jgi:ATP-dependent DNA helicase RecQ
MLEGLTVVISPLISLMKDQVSALEEAGIRAAFLNSALSQDVYWDTFFRAGRGEYKIVYIAPERLAGDGMARLAASLPIGLVVIDEAHCVSHWGHDFRPSYLRVNEFIGGLARRPVTAAFTATATVAVRSDIALMLNLKEPLVLTTGFDRENLYFEVRRPAHKDKMAALLACLDARREKCGIIYCATRKAVDEVAGGLAARGFSVTRYHAGLDDEERRRNQDDFIFDRKTLMTATNAFGMGINKSNVGFVIHYNMPKNIESYYQEAGRAGRDGLPADCILLYSPRDVKINEYLITRAGESGAENDEELVRRKRELLREMTFYATGRDCLRGRILRYFGESPPRSCGNCSVCSTVYENTDISIEAQKIISCVFRLKQRNLTLGKKVIVDILRGRRTRKIRAGGLDTLSTYGIMAALGEEKIRSIVDFLVSGNYLVREAQAGEEEPVLAPSSRSGEIIFEKKPLFMRMPKEPAGEEKKREGLSGELPAEFSAERGEGASSVSSLFSDFDSALFAKLKELRSRLAEEARVPAYIVFSDASLKDMCRKMPCDGEMFLRVSGVGAVKREKYAEAFTGVIRAYMKEAEEG